ncbi:S-layer homology domain-containing protein [Geobacillus subterraneus]|uniref:S-layer homology domain-containing protein n=1 Tax=Geobacillus subterraneus TaxID=129338 RepID=UPI001442AF96|nr:S-layer homology domain-containing protein [Geobacillus subterraneus]QIZ65927.1 S-layer homology domain-containing protein [Geobacillus subterraneus]
MAYQPKSYRKFAATTATAAMVASAVAPVASLAAGFTDVAPQYKEAVDFLVSTGATNGKTETQFGVYEQITRLDAAVILAKVLKLDVENAKDAGFTDVPKDRAKYVNALVEAGILNGKGDGKFGAYDNLSRVEMAKIVANAYKLEKQNDSALPFTDVNATWAPFVKALYDNGVTSGKTPTSFGAYENITRGDFARFVFKAANVNVAPAVVSVSAINASQVVVKFNKTVDKDTAETESNYQVNGQDLNAYDSSATAVLGEDKKSVTITFSTNHNNKAFNLKVKSDAVKTEDKKATIAEYVGAVQVSDNQGPSVTKVEFAANGDLEITFSEPLKNVNPIVRVNNTPVTITAVSALDTKVVVPAANLPTIAKGETATVYVANAQDMAANTMDIFNGSVVKPNDTTAPTVTSLTQVGHNKVRFVFSEPLAGSGAGAFTADDIKVLKGSTVYTSTTSGVSFTVTKNTTVDPTGKTYDVEVVLDSVAGSPNFGIYSSTSNTQSLTFMIDADQVTDAYGNKMGAFNQTLTLTKDATGPVLDKSAVSSDKQTLELTFNEALLSGTSNIDETKIIVTDANGVRYNVLDASTDVKSGTGNEKILVVDFVSGTSTIENGTYTIQVQKGAVKDVLGNVNEAFTTTVNVGNAADTSKPTVTLDTETTTDTLVSSENKFVVDFSEEVTSTALDLANYALDGKSLPSGTIIYFNTAAKNSVTIELPEGSIGFGTVGTGADALLRVSNVADKAGNIMNATTLNVKVSDNTTALLQGVQVIGNDIILTFNEALDSTSVTAIDTPAELAANFEIKVNGEDLNLGTGGAVATSLVAGNNKQIKVSLTPGTGSNWSPTASLTAKVKSTATIKDANLFTVKEGTAVSKQ